MSSFIWAVLQGMPQDQGMDVRIAEGMLKAMGRAIAPQLETLDTCPYEMALMSQSGGDPDGSMHQAFGEMKSSRDYLRELLGGVQPGRLLDEQQEMRAI